MQHKVAKMNIYTSSVAIIISFSTNRDCHAIPNVDKEESHYPKKKLFIACGKQLMIDSLLFIKQKILESEHRDYWQSGVIFHLVLVHYSQGEEKKTQH